MGDPRRLKKRYHSPNNPYERSRVLEELKYIGKYGLRNKQEFWRHRYQLGGFRARARKARSQTQEVQEIMLEDLRTKLTALGILGPEAHFDDVLGLEIEQLLDRRLQTMVFKKGLAKSIYQARQFIVHRHIIVGERVISSPSYLVKKDEEAHVEYAPNSPIKNMTLEQIEGSGAEGGKEEA